MKFSGMIICSDVDGTLIDEKNTVPKNNIEAIEYFRAHGGNFMIATGRVPEAVTSATGDLAFDYPGICHNGCSVYDFNENAYKETIEIDERAIHAAEEIMGFMPSSGVEVMTAQGIYVVKRTPATDFHITFEKVDAVFIDRIEDAPKPWFKILFAQKPDETDTIKEAFLNSPHNKNYNLIKTHHFYYEIFNKFASKGAALKKFCEHNGIDTKNVIAIGDNENDITMLDVAGVSAAVAGASDIVKSHADIITCSNEDGAIADLISKL